MISMEELLHGHNINDCSDEQRSNLETLQTRVNKLRSDWGKPLIVTSGLRDEADMKRIYKSDNFPKKSKHLFGQACDLADTGTLMSWLKENDSARMKEYDLWGELGTNGWVHLQIVPFGSYNKETDIRWFNP
jgi:uncharacterized protein YcbK (DUF882 family)